MHKRRPFLASELSIFLRTHPNVRRDLLCLGQPDHGGWAARPATPLPLRAMVLFSPCTGWSVILAHSADANRFDRAIAVTAQLAGLCSMDWPDYLRDQAAKYRQLAEQTDDPVIKDELLELASVCEEVASNIEDHLTGG